MTNYGKPILDKIKNKEDLTLREMQVIERLLLLSSIYDDLLDIQIGLRPNDYNLEYVKSEVAK